MLLLTQAINTINLTLKNKLTHAIIPYTKFIENILNLLIKEGVINNYTYFINKNNQFLYLKIFFKYYQNNTIIKNLQLITTSGRKQYSNYNLIKKKNKLNKITIISTSKGLITNRDLYLKKEKNRRKINIIL